MSSVSSDEDLSDTTRFLLPQGIEDSEEVERYALGGYHPVHLGDQLDRGRYKICHKLGAGGFATVWLARDLTAQKWSALKIFVADESRAVESKMRLSRRMVEMCDGAEDTLVTYDRSFYIEGPNGRHLCLVLPVLGPSTRKLSNHLDSRIYPGLARVVSLQAVEALADLHAHGLCHGDFTTANILLRLEEDLFNRYSESDIYRIFGTPFQAPLETESGEEAGPEAPKYIVKALDFLTAEEDIISNDVCIIDFDQAFPASAPPDKMLGTPMEYLAPEVAVGRPASSASDVWALGCVILKLRSGVGPFSAYDNTSPCDLLRDVMRPLGELPVAWRDTLFDEDGQPTEDPERGQPMWRDTQTWSLKDWVYKIWDRPEIEADHDHQPTEEQQAGGSWKGGEVKDKPYPACFDGKFFKPGVIRVGGNKFLTGYDDDWDMTLQDLPKISKGEAALLWDLVSKIFVYDPSERISAQDLFDHPWFRFQS